MASPNILLFVGPDDGTVDVVGVSDQRLSHHLKHIGNITPSCASTLEDMIRYATIMGNWLQEAGFTGLTGFDFVEYVDGASGEFRCILAEINARTNGAAYPSLLMEYVNARQIDRGYPMIGAFLSALVPTRTGFFTEIVQIYQPYLFNPRMGRGLIPYGFCQKTLCCNMVFLGQSRHDVEEMSRTFLSHR